MVNPFEGLISAEFKGLYTSLMDELVRGCEVPCILKYGVSKYDDCVNCIFSPIGNKSANRYQTGGPMPFSVGMCPMCFGAGKIPVVTDVPISLIPLWDSKEWVGVSGLDIGNVNQHVQTMGKVETYDDVREAKSIIIDTSLTQYARNEFERVSEPQACGFDSSSYIFTLWKRIQ